MDMDDYEDDDEDYGNARRGDGWIRIDVNLKREVAVDGTTVHTGTVAATGVEQSLLQRVVRDEVQRLVKDLIDKELRKSLSEMVANTVEKTAAPRVEKMLDEGWSEYGKYGGEQKKTTLADAVVAAVETPKNGDYYSGKKPMGLIERVVDARVTQMLDYQFKAQLDEGVKAFRSRVDELLNAKIAEGLRAALGLR